MILVSLTAEIGASKHGSSVGVQKLKERLVAKHPEISEHMVLIRQKQCFLEDFFRFAKNFEDYYFFCKDSLIPSMRAVFKKGGFPIVLSAEHSGAFGIVQALRSVHPNKKIGILYIDAHADLHTAYDSDSGNLHGMPLGMVLNRAHSGQNSLNPQEIEYWERLCALDLPRGALEFNPKHLIYFGVRSTEASERKMIKDCVIPLFSVQEIRENISNVVAQSVKYLEGVDLVYLSLDIDVLDGKIFSSTGVRENNGLHPDELKELFNKLLRAFQERLVGVELTEYNPELWDGTNPDEEVIWGLLEDVVLEMREKC
ncbi:arginase [Helicobacter ailurogastricus]|uniref:arginase n=1 Tax=Helicobacter ailurogastricus TaxID=1578720 RepID=UPI0022C7B4D1|nr:arginase [Helicobacter ailurogastricus]GLH57331.1 Arginase RocF [Helicobacter ailurogastricus]GLH59522.1 Arginase RocF [Helicobacter ailurogastricus]